MKENLLMDFFWRADDNYKRRGYKWREISLDDISYYFSYEKKLAMINSNWAKARAIKNFNSLKNIKLLINNYKIQLIINNYKIQLIINNYKIQLIINNYFFLYLFFKSFKNWIRL